MPLSVNSVMQMLRLLKLKFGLNLHLDVATLIRNSSESLTQFTIRSWENWLKC